MDATKKVRAKLSEIIRNYLASDENPIPYYISKDEPPSKERGTVDPVEAMFPACLERYEQHKAYERMTGKITAELALRKDIKNKEDEIESARADNIKERYRRTDIRIKEDGTQHKVEVTDSWIMSNALLAHKVYQGTIYIEFSRWLLGETPQLPKKQYSGLDWAHYYYYLYQIGEYPLLGESKEKAYAEIAERIGLKSGYFKGVYIEATKPNRLKNRSILSHLEKIRPLLAEHPGALELVDADIATVKARQS